MCLILRVFPARWPQRVLHEFGLEIVETVECDDEGKLLLSASGAKKSPQDQADVNLWRNDNRTRVSNTLFHSRPGAKSR